MARWVYEYEGVRRCENCGYEYDKMNSKGDYQAAFYCPWCGEEMEGE